MNIKLSPLVIFTIFLATFYPEGVRAQTSNLTILNPSFELQSSTAAGSYTPVLGPTGVTDWTIADSYSGLTVNALINLPNLGWSGPSQGTNAFQIYNINNITSGVLSYAYIYQTLSSDYVAGDTYTLSADAQSYAPAELYMGTNTSTNDIVASTNFNTGSSLNIFSSYNLNFTATSAQAGLPITIGFFVPSISGQGGDTVDNFHLVQSVPEPSIYALFGLGVLAFIVASRHRLA